MVAAAAVAALAAAEAALGLAAADSVAPAVGSVAAEKAAEVQNLPEPSVELELEKTVNNFKHTCGCPAQFVPIHVMTTVKLFPMNGVCSLRLLPKSWPVFVQFK